MVYLPTKKVTGKHYKIYKEPLKKGKKIPSKAELLRRALKRVSKLEDHEEWIDFIPARFTLQCYDDKTEILTEKNGWKLFKDLKPEDKVACLVRKGAGKRLALEFHKPEKIWVQDYDGDLYAVENSDISLAVTPEHNLFHRRGERAWKTINVKKALKKERIVMNPGLANWEGKFHCPVWFEFLGFWFADGTFSLNKVGSSRNHRIYFTQKSQKKYLKDLIKRVGLAEKLRISPRAPQGTLTFTIEGKELATYFSQFGKKENKSIPLWIRQADKDALKAFLEGFTKGDGYRRKRDWRLFNSNKKIIDQLQEIALKAGYWAVVRRNKNIKNSFAPNSIKYILWIKQKQREIKVWSREWKKVQYQGKIYSVKVSSGVILVRRDGKPCFSGNCHGWVDKGIYPSADAVKKIVDRCLRAKKDPLIELQGKWHYDIRIQKVDASTWFGFCFDEKTEIFTEEGWKFFKDLTGNERVATRGKDDEIVFKKPRGIVNRPYSGEMIIGESSQFSMKVLPSHFCYCKKQSDSEFKRYPASEIYGQSIYFWRGVKWKGKKNITFANRSLDKNFAEFIGFYLAEGYAKKGGKTICLTQKTKVRYVRDLLRRNKLVWKEYQQSNKAFNFVITSLNRTPFSKLGKSLVKFIPYEIKQAEPPILKALIWGYSQGDGHKRKKDWKLFTSSKKLADDLQEVCFKAGYVANVSSYVPKKNTSFSTKTKYRIHILKELCERQRKSDPRNVYLSKRGRHWRIEYYEGRIYDVVMPENTVCLVRRNGKYHWSYRTLFRLPLTGRPEDKILGTVKGYQSLVKGGKALQDFLRKKAQRIITSEGVKERMDRPEWMKIKKQMWAPGTLGSPTKQPGYMIAIESEEPAVLHRRELDFIDVTFLGKHLRGRYYYRLVERELSPDELTKEKRESGKKYYGLQFFFWRAKRCFDEKEMEKIAKLKKIKEPIPVTEQKKFTKEQKSLKGWKYKRKGKIYIT